MALPVLLFSVRCHVNMAISFLISVLFSLIVVSTGAILTRRFLFIHSPVDDGFHVTLRRPCLSLHFYLRTYLLKKKGQKEAVSGNIKYLCQENWALRLKRAGKELQKSWKDGDHAGARSFYGWGASGQTILSPSAEYVGHKKMAACRCTDKGIMAFYKYWQCLEEMLANKRKTKEERGSSLRLCFCSADNIF